MLNVNKSACIIGGGFYGVVIALYLKRIIGLKTVEIYEQESKLISKASFKNQARIHNGYHYPRSFITAYRSRENFNKFISDFSECVESQFNNYYALAKRNSKISPYQFERFCKDVGISFMKAEKNISELFNPALVSAIYKVQEYAFNAAKLREWSYREISNSDIDCFFNNRVLTIKSDDKNGINVVSKNNSGDLKTTRYSYVFNCTYSGLTQVDPFHPVSALRLKHEIAEIALIDLPSELKNFGITLIDGPFFSTIPFPSKDCHSLTHVRYTPHSFWIDKAKLSPYEVIKNRKLETRVDRMIRDASRYLPLIAESRYKDSLFEVKTILEKNELDDGRPILFRESLHTPKFYSVLGGKIDNIYDILKAIDNL